ncbi:hypothetical protein [Actinomycetospora corticicola]|uniref:Uncharacterized protein n=1 Tax=Actinomycetospora corticicola TaxID=663602 RepID=A0A7Y9DZ80_9PSEU|nr:hypothetical protein [Actinomycetospora corticicola]NYD37952.1 hypothetical protein [Actinomycetospora corticicola]
MTAENGSQGPATQGRTVEGSDVMGCYLELLDHAYQWGVRQALLRRRLDLLCDRAGGEGAGAEDVDELLATWQMLRAFPADRPPSLTA